jgi:hypothetical protein
VFYAAVNMSKLFRKFEMPLKCFPLNTANLTQYLDDAFFRSIKVSRVKLCLSERVMLRG